MLKQFLIPMTIIRFVIIIMIIMIIMIIIDDY